MGVRRRELADAAQGGASGLSRDSQADFVVGPAHIAGTAKRERGREYSQAAL